MLLNTPERVLQDPASELRPSFTYAVEPWANRILGKEAVPTGYSNDWPAWEDWLDWQGLPGDRAWLISHAYGYLGRPTPLAYSVCEIFGSSKVYFQAGGLYFLLDLSASEEPTLDCYDASVQWSNIVEGSVAPSHQMFPHLSAYREARWYRYFVFDELKVNGRNRWIEQKERGGRPPAQLLRTREELELRFDNHD